jgi:hypothetical protein
MQTSEPPASITLLNMMTGYWISQGLCVAAKLGVADHLADGTLSCAELATKTRTHVQSLHRLLRALASSGVFAETTPGYFALTPLAALLRDGTPGSMRALAIMYNEEQYRAWGDLLHSVQTGAPAFDYVFGMNPFEYFRKNPEPARVFNDAMTAWTNSIAQAVPRMYDFSELRTVVDVGGSHGVMLAAILMSNPASRGILFDLPHVVEGAEALLRAAAVADRCTCVGGDFFAEALPRDGDAYILASILHDFDDERCTAILKRCRQAMPDHGKLLVVELVLPPGEEPFFGKWLDLHMLVLTPGGRERTAAEYETLFKTAEFALARIVPTPVGQSIMEAVPV